MQRLQGRLAVVTGAANGIGRATALRFASEGANLALIDLERGGLDRVAEEARRHGAQVHTIAGDCTDEATVVKAFEEIRQTCGFIDILMNNVGSMLNGHPEDIPFSEYHRIMDINYFAAVRGCAHFLPKFLARGSGHIVNTASFAGLYPYGASRVPYTSAKAATISLTQNLAVYCEPLGVRVSCLIPGPVMTGVMDSMTSWTENCTLRGPGSETTLLLPEQLATELSDGMAAGRIIIPSDPVAFDIVKRWAENPDAFIRAKIAEFESGNTGSPRVPEELLKLMGRA